MKIYTRTGDDGTTGLWGGTRVPKCAQRVEAYGAVDELNASLGLVRTTPFDHEVDALLFSIQEDLFRIGSELAAAPQSTKGAGIPVLAKARITELENAIDRFESELAPLKNFILPGGSVPSAHLHLARTICRRAERAVVALLQTEPVREELLHYLNRMSDLLFVLARLANHRANLTDIAWNPRRNEP